MDLYRQQRAGNFSKIELGDFFLKKGALLDFIEETAKKYYKDFEVFYLVFSPEEEQKILKFFKFISKSWKSSLYIYGEIPKIIPFYKEVKIIADIVRLPEKYPDSSPGYSNCLKVSRR